MEIALKDDNQGEGQDDDSSVDNLPGSKPKWGARSLGPNWKWSEEEYDTWQKKSLAGKGDILRERWADVAYMALRHAERMGKSLTKKEYHLFQRLLVSAGIAYDKVAPKTQPLVSFNLFQGLDQSTLRQVVGIEDALPNPMPASQVIDVQGESDKA